MARHQAFSFKHFGLRFLFALVLVMGTYNPTGYSFIHWLVRNFPAITPVIAVSGSLVIIGWAIYLRASLRSLGTAGLILAAVFFGCLLWLFVDIGWLQIGNMGMFSWVVLVILALIMAVGISWSHIRRRITGQVDTDDVDN